MSKTDHTHRPKRVLVVGSDHLSMEMLSTVDWGTEIEFVSLFDIEEVRPPDPTHELDFFNLIATAQQRIADDPGPVDAVVGWWDFPTSGLVPMLRRYLGQPGADLRSVATLEHKYWSRLIQRTVVPEAIPNFGVIDPFTVNATDVDMDFPFWIKPIKSHSSHLGYRIHDRHELREALDEIRRGISVFGVPFDQFLSLIDLPKGVARVTGHHCLIEEIISSGRQFTMEGFVHNGRTVIYGVVDSIRSGIHQSSMSRYQYPSTIPEEVQERAAAVTEKVMTQAGYDGSPFNIEFFWDRDSDGLKLLEVNTRISKSHCPLFWMVDGESHQKILVQLALGLEPTLPKRQGRHKVAAKFMIRAFEDGRVEHVPDDDEVLGMQERFPTLRFKPLVEEGTRLSHLHYQDSYSFGLANLFLGAEDEDELLKRFEIITDTLPLRYRPLPSEAA